MHTLLLPRSGRASVPLRFFCHKCLWAIEIHIMLRPRSIRLEALPLPGDSNVQRTDGAVTFIHHVQQSLLLGCVRTTAQHQQQPAAHTISISPHKPQTSCLLG